MTQVPWFLLSVYWNSATWPRSVGGCLPKFLLALYGALLMSSNTMECYTISFPRGAGNEIPLSVTTKEGVMA